MRIFLFLAATLFTALNAKLRRDVSEYKLPDGFPDGTMLTFFFWHEGDSSELMSTGIDFYDVPSADLVGESYDITAHLRIDRDLEHPVVSNTFVDGQWRKQSREEQPLDVLPPRDGWWRVDVYKHDKSRLNVFFQGFWSDVRTFDKSLDEVKSIRISGHVDHTKVQIRQKVPNGIIAPMTKDQFKDALYGDFSKDIKLVTLPGFPVGTTIEVAALLAAAGGERNRVPALAFKAGNDNDYFMKIFQKWEGDREAMYLSSSGPAKFCTNEMPNGDLQHILLKRISQNTLKVTVFYKISNLKSNGVTCEHTLPEDAANKLDGSFDILSQDGAIIFHLENTMVPL